MFFFPFKYIQNNIINAVSVFKMELCNSNKLLITLRSSKRLLAYHQWYAYRRLERTVLNY
jgi:hypothetical protein